MSQVNFILCLHNHQPVGNFENVFESAYRQAYEPFFEVADKFPQIKLCLHYSGPLLEWLERAHPKFITRLREQVNQGRIEMLGGGMYEPILTLLTDEDKIGQIKLFSDYLNNLFGKRPRGVWLAERVWEQSLTKPLAEAGVEYTIVDDFHFKTAGFTEKQLEGYYLTEDQGKTLAVFSIPETLRYAIPFKTPWDTIAYLQTKKNSAQTIVSYADDGEKFGVWPQTFKHCYEEKWLANFFKTLQDAGSNGWLKVTTFSDVLNTVKPRGKAYLPDCSYREMTEWALPAEYAIAYEDTIKHSNKCTSAGFIIQPGGYWRNFRVKYPEINIMYSKMMEVSQKVTALKGKDKKSAALPRNNRDFVATTELYKGQGNCAYWHGVFGGFYLPHLRHAIYQHLIAADELASGHNKTEIIKKDFDLDGFEEIRLSNSDINCYLKPSQGGTIYEFDIIKKQFNPLATLGRRQEAYHHKILEAQGTGSDQASSIHDLVVSKTKGLENLLYYDNYLRQSLIDHFIPKDTTLDNFSKCHYVEQGDFIKGEYQVKSAGKSVTLSRNGAIKQGEKVFAVRIEKTVSLSGNLSLLIEYAVTNIGQVGGDPATNSGERLTTTFAPEFNLSMLAGNAYDRYYYDGIRKNIGPLITTGESKAPAQPLRAEAGFGIKDEYQKIDIGFTLDNPADIWFFPVQTVSQSEGGFELIYQSSAILPRWELNLEPGQKWQTQIIKKVVFL